MFLLEMSDTIVIQSYKHSWGLYVVYTGFVLIGLGICLIPVIATKTRRAKPTKRWLILFTGCISLAVIMAFVGITASGESSVMDRQYRALAEDLGFTELTVLSTGFDTRFFGINAEGTYQYGTLRYVDRNLDSNTTTYALVSAEPGVN